ncbi:MAG TPA: tripartite tricarboxylate transporter substrate-binding protein [Streptosporangiaceae bacterium]|nr:tripartite tricarboxylate transporter substrate-binding protein [Streptosporangiaceae bacterium]
MDNQQASWRCRARWQGHAGRRRGAMTVAAVACAGLVAACGSSSGPGPAGSSASPSRSGSSASAASYFKGKTITLIAPDKPGGSYDSYARLFAPYVAKELGATINVTNVAGAGTVEGTNQMAAASPDGLTIGMVNIGGDIASKVEHQPGQSFDMAKLSWIGQPAQVPNAMVTQPGSPVQSFAALRHATKPVTVLDIRNGVGDMLNRVVFGAFRIPHTLATGFESTSSLKQGFLAKDGQVIFEAMSTLYPLISGHQATPLLVTGSVTLPSYQKVLQGTPTLQSELSKASLSSADASAVQEAIRLSDLSDAFAAPAGLPSSKLAALRQAFAKAANSPALKAQAVKESLPISFTDGATLAGQVNTALGQANAIAPFVNGKG